MATLKRCAHCKLFKSIEEFGFQKSRKDGHYPYCKLCHRTLTKQWCQARALVGETIGFPLTKKCLMCKEVKTRDLFRNDRRRFDHKKPYCITCSRAYEKQYYQDVRQLHSDKDKIAGKSRRDSLRAQVLLHYSNGTNICACCGENRVEFLGIDHINGGGRKHRREVKNFYSWLRRNHYPDGFRVLCHNCNFSRGHYGYCPHEHETHQNGTARPIDLASGTLRVSCWQH